MFSKGWQVTETATSSQNAPYSHCQAKHTGQGGKEQPWGDTHPNTQSLCAPEMPRKSCPSPKQEQMPMAMQRLSWAVPAAYRTGLRHIKAEGQQD